MPPVICRRGHFHRVKKVFRCGLSRKFPVADPRQLFKNAWEDSILLCHSFPQVWWWLDGYISRRYVPYTKGTFPSTTSLFKRKWWLKNFEEKKGHSTVLQNDAISSRSLSTAFPPVLPPFFRLLFAPSHRFPRSKWGAQTTSPPTPVPKIERRERRHNSTPNKSATTCIPLLLLTL